MATLNTSTSAMARIDCNLPSDFSQTPKNLWHNLGLLSRARVVKLVDAGDSKSPAARRAGSIPAPGTIGNIYRPDSIARFQIL